MLTSGSTDRRLTFLCAFHMQRSLAVGLALCVCKCDVAKRAALSAQCALRCRLCSAPNQLVSLSFERCKRLTTASVHKETKNKNSFVL